VPFVPALGGRDGDTNGMSGRMPFAAALRAHL
jgi:hypothetical protein